MLNRPDGDRQFVGILAAVLTHGLEAVVDACVEAVAARSISQGVILNLLSRAQEPTQTPENVALPHLPQLRTTPVSDCRRYDLLLMGGGHVA